MKLCSTEILFTKTGSLSSGSDLWTPATSLNKGDYENIFRLFFYIYIYIYKTTCFYFG